MTDNMRLSEKEVRQIQHQQVAGEGWYLLKIKNGQPQFMFPVIKNNILEKGVK
jgi:hypothetical protein